VATIKKKKRTSSRYQTPPTSLNRRKETQAEASPALQRKRRKRLPQASSTQARPEQEAPIEALRRKGHLQPKVKAHCNQDKSPQSMGEEEARRSVLQVHSIRFQFGFAF
jgi:hypothetical protein